MGKNWAIAIGINHYDNLQPLKYAQRDAEVMTAWFENEAKFDQVFLFTEDSPPIRQVNPPISTQPTYGRLRRFFRAQFEKPLLQAGDNLWFFFAGHGKRYDNCDYLMLSDSDPGDIEDSALSVSWITERLRRWGADNVVMFLDACRDTGARNGIGIGTEKQPGVITFYACSPNQQSYEIKQLSHGSFTYSLLESLQIQGEGNCATVERLYQRLRYRVSQINGKYEKPLQIPYAVIEPATKFHLILLPDYATLADIAQLKLDAYQAEVTNNWELAKQLWIRVNVAARGSDVEAIEAFSRITQTQSSTTNSNESNSSTGGRGTNTETTAQREEQQQQNLAQYRNSFSQAVEQEFPLSKASRRKLVSLQQSLQLTDKEVSQIEKLIIAQKEAERRQQQEQESHSQKNSTNKNEKSSYFLLLTSYFLLLTPYSLLLTRYFQARIRQKQEAERRQQQEQERIRQQEQQHQQNLAQYRQKFSQIFGLEFQFPLSEASRRELRSLQQSLQLTDKEVSQIEQLIIGPKEAEIKKRQEQEKIRQQQEAQRIQQHTQETIRQQKEAHQRRKEKLFTSIISRRKFLQWTGLGGGGLAIAVLAREMSNQPTEETITTTKNTNNKPTNKPRETISVAEPKYIPPTEGVLWTLKFETVTVDAKGEVIKRDSNKEAKFFKEDLGNGVILEMVSIPGSSFKMGSPPGEKNRSKDESPQHTVNVSAFFMGMFEVTQEQYQQVVDENPSKFKGDKRPVESVSWNDAVEFCKKLSQKTGRTYRLPSEAEWEYACRAGTTTPFHFGETITTDLVNYNGNYTYASAPKGKYREETTPVGLFPPNSFGLYDMHGNAWEWCQDTWHDNYNDAPKDGSAWIENDNSSLRVLRGGSWYYVPWYCRSADRNYGTPSSAYYNIGFRVVCVVAP